MPKNITTLPSPHPIVDQHLIDKIISAYNTPTDYADHSSLRSIAEAFSMTPLKVRKLLITGGAFSSATSRAVARLYSEGKTIAEIEKHLNLSYASIHAYLPYSKAVYKTEKISRNAQRIRVYRKRQEAVEQIRKVIRDAAENSSDSEIIQDIETKHDRESLHKSKALPKSGSLHECIPICEESLGTMIWNTLILFQNYAFNTAKGFNFTYIIKGDELLIQGCMSISKHIGDTLRHRRIAKVSRRIRYAVTSPSCPNANYRQAAQRNIHDTVSITRSNVLQASLAVIALQLNGTIADGSKKLETYGAEYLYPVFLRVGIIER